MQERRSFEREMEDLGLKVAEIGQGFRSALFQGDSDLFAVLNGQLRLGRKGDPQYPAPIKSEGEAISKVQRALIELGYPLTIYGANGKFNEETYKVVYDYKNRYGIRTEDGFLDGIVGIKTIKHLDNALTERQISVRFFVQDKDGKPISGKRYKMELAGDVYLEDVTGPDGLIEQIIPRSSTKAKLTVWPNENSQLDLLSWGLDITKIESIDSVSGIQRRLRNLGYYLGDIDNILGQKTRSALRHFQVENGIPPTMQPDLQTKTALIKAHHS